MAHDNLLNSRDLLVYDCLLRFLFSFSGTGAAGAAGIIFSGNDSDSCLGLKAIKEVGGLVVVQEPQSANCDAMPLNAIATGLLDYILSPRKNHARIDCLY